ncbi:MAG: DUF1269 domain-containing protein [Gammaproteobacteria bacterium]|nr:hypothetical protein [Gammaproteobacteria bacterium]
MNKFVVVVFPDEGKADEGVRALQALHDDGEITLYGLRVAHKSEGGEIALVEKVGMGMPGAAVGALAGALVGLLGGPLGAVAGLAGGAWIGTWRDITQLGIGSDFLEEVSRELAPGTTAIIADITEDRVAPLDERMAALHGVVLREWQTEYGEMRLLTEAAARKTEIEHLDAERRSATDAQRALLDIRLDRAARRLDDVAQRARSALDSLVRRSDSKLRTLEQQAATARGQARRSIERRAAEIREDRARREQLLNRAIDIAAAARI